MDPTKLHARGIAARVRGLIGGQDGGDLRVTAERLSVDESALRMTIDPSNPTAATSVLAAVVSVYGVDPHWLLCGEYDSRTHRSAIDQDRRTTPVDVAAVAAKIAERPRLEA